MISARQSRQLYLLSLLESNPELKQAIEELENIAEMCTTAAHELAGGGFEQDKLLFQSNIYASLAALLLREGVRPDPELELVRA